MGTAVAMYDESGRRSVLRETEFCSDLSMYRGNAIQIYRTAHTGELMTDAAERQTNSDRQTRAAGWQGGRVAGW